MENKQFTKDELHILLIGMGALIDNLNKALQIIGDKSSTSKELVEDTLKKYQELNVKICSMIK